MSHHEPGSTEGGGAAGPDPLGIAARLASGLAHDLNNILIVIKGYSEVALGSGVEDPVLADQLRKIAAAAERAAQLTNQLSLFGRGQTVTGAPADADRLIVRLLGQARAALRRGAVLDVALGAPGTTVQVDSAMLVEALRALLTWGAEGSAAGAGLALTTRWEPIVGGAAGAGWFHIEFKDAGPDLDPEHYPHLFEPFYSAKEVRRGSGLGLAVVHGVARQHRGRVGAGPHPGGGTRITLSFEATASAGVGAVSWPVGRVRPEAGEMQAVCLVTADVRVRDWVESALRELGCRVVCAGSPVEAEALWQRRSGLFDLIIEDGEVAFGAAPVEWLPPRAAGAEPVRVLELVGDRFRLSGEDAISGVEVSFLGRSGDAVGLSRAVGALLDRRRRRAQPGPVG